MVFYDNMLKAYVAEFLALLKSGPPGGEYGGAPRSGLQVPRSPGREYGGASRPFLQVLGHPEGKHGGAPRPILQVPRPPGTCRMTGRGAPPCCPQGGPGTCRTGRVAQQYALQGGPDN